MSAAAVMLIEVLPAHLTNFDLMDRGHMTSCWVWRGSLRKGRPLVRIECAYSYAHREIWTCATGDDLDPETPLMRQCPEIRCVNPDHYRYPRRLLGLPLKEPVTPEQQRLWNLRKYGITPEQYDALLEAQGGVCAVCPRDESDRLGRRLHVDHDHETGHVRGLLCSRCNNAIGQAGESPERLRALADYVERSRPSL